VISDQQGYYTRTQGNGPILLVTVTGVEFDAVCHACFEVTHQKIKEKKVGNFIYYYLGISGGKPAYMVKSQAGSGGPGGSTITISDAIRVLKPKSVILVGIAFGLQPHKQKLGEILVSKQLMFYSPAKVKGTKVIPRGNKVGASKELVDQFEIVSKDWETRNDVKVHFGLVLSGPILAASEEFTRQLLEIESEAEGGEMEGEGLYSAAKDNAEWILVKAICDWGDEKKNDEYQKQAAHNAAQFVVHVLQLTPHECIVTRILKKIYRFLAQLPLIFLFLIFALPGSLCLLAFWLTISSSPPKMTPSPEVIFTSTIYSFTSSPSPSAFPIADSTVLPTPTLIYTTSPTFTPTFTSPPTPTPTFTSTHPFTLTPSATPTPIFTSTNPFTPTPSATLKLTPAFTPTTTPSPCCNPTLTPTRTSDSKPTSTKPPGCYRSAFTSPKPGQQPSKSVIVAWTPSSCVMKLDVHYVSQDIHIQFYNVQSPKSITLSYSGKITLKLFYNNTNTDTITITVP
jgi:nucleoside phosphorylase